MSLSLLLDNSDVSTGLGPRETPHTTTGEIAGAAISYMRDNFNIESSWRLHRRHLKDRTEKYYELTGEKGKFYDGVIWGYPGDDRIDQQREEIDNAIMEGRAGPDSAKWFDIMTTEEAREAARQDADMSREEFESAMANAAPEAWADTAKYAGMFAGGMTDWLNLPTAFIGFGAGRSLWQVAKINAVANMAIEGASQPSVMAWQKELKQEYGLSDAVLSITFAGAFGAGLPIAFKAASRGVSSALKFRGFDARKLGKYDVLARENSIKELPDSVPPTSKAKEAHAENLPKAAKAAQEGRIVDEAELNPASAPNKFDSDDVQHEHIALHDEAVAAGLSPRSKEYKEFIEERIEKQIRADMQRTVDAVDPVDVDSFSARIAQLRDLITAHNPVNLEQTVRKKLGPNATEKQVRAEMDVIEREKMPQWITELTDKRTRVEDTKRAAQIRDELDGNGSGQIEKAVQKQAKLVGKANKERLVSGNDPLQKPKGMSREELDEANEFDVSPEAEASADAHISRLENDEEDLVIDFDKDYNPTRTMKDEIKALRREEEISRIIQSCGIPR